MNINMSERQINRVFDLLNQRIENQVNEYTDAANKMFEFECAVHSFFEKRPDLIPEFVANVYQHSESAKVLVEHFHSERLCDLSKVECSKAHFKSWA